MVSEVFPVSNTIYENTITDCERGIYSENSNDKIMSNNLLNNFYGIWTYNSTDTINYNRISQNHYGLRNDINTVNATNNWWGSNDDPLTIQNNIENENGTVIYAPWLVLSINASSISSGGKTSITADLTHNNQGGDTSSRGHVPDNIPIDFATNFGNITNTSYTIKGKATSILNLGNNSSNTVTATASIDNQSISTIAVIATGSEYFKSQRQQYCQCHK